MKVNERNGAVTTEQREIQLEREGDIGWILINRPHRLNAFAGSMRSELLAALQEMEGDDAVRCVVVTGVGRAFSTGGDVAAMARMLGDDDRGAFEELVRAGSRVVTQIHEMAKPVIAGVNGIAAGAGACLALACDLRIASESASIGFTFGRVGLHPDWGGTYFLPRMVGPSLAAEFFLTGEMISAERAERLGIFNRVVPQVSFEAATRSFAGEIAAKPRVATRGTKRALRASLGSNLAEMLELETAAQLEAFDSPEAREGITAFLEKRAPRFSSR